MTWEINIRQRISKLRKLLAINQNSLILISNPYNIAYLTGIENLLPGHREAYLLLSQNLCEIFVSPLIKIKSLLSETKITTLQPQILSRRMNAELTNSKQKIIAFEARDLRVSELLNFQKQVKAEFIPVLQLIEKLRMIKDQDEIKRITKACQITSRTFKAVIQAIKPGMTEKQISSRIVAELKARGADFVPEGFEPIVASGTNSAIPHHRCSDRQVTAKDVVLMDFGCCYRGYCSDMTRTIKLGKQTAEFKKLENAVLSAYQAALRKIKQTKSLVSISRQVELTLSRKGFSNRMPHALGHGVGLQVQELPQIHPHAKAVLKLKPGMVIAVEPGIYFPGKYGFRYENTLLLADSGPAPLT